MKFATHRAPPANPDTMSPVIASAVAAPPRANLKPYRGSPSVPKRREEEGGTCSKVSSGVAWGGGGWIGDRGSRQGVVLMEGRGHAGPSGGRVSSITGKRQDDKDDDAITPMILIAVPFHSVYVVLLLTPSLPLLLAPCPLSLISWGGPPPHPPPHHVV